MTRRVEIPFTGVIILQSETDKTETELETEAILCLHEIETEINTNKPCRIHFHAAQPAK